MQREIEKYVIPLAKGVSIIEKWYNLDPDLQEFRAYLWRKLVKRLGSEKLEEEIRSMSYEKLYEIIREISAQFLRKER